MLLCVGVYAGTVPVWSFSLGGRGRLRQHVSYAFQCPWLRYEDMLQMLVEASDSEDSSLEDNPEENNLFDRLERSWWCVGTCYPIDCGWVSLCIYSLLCIATYSLFKSTTNNTALNCCFFHQNVYIMCVLSHYPYLRGTVFLVLVFAISWQEIGSVGSY